MSVKQVISSLILSILLLTGFAAGLNIPLNETDQAALVGGFTLYASALCLAGKLDQRLWMGYISLAMNLLWLTLGIGMALLLLFVVTSIVLGICYRHDAPSRILAQIIGRILITGVGLWFAFVSYSILLGDVQWAIAPSFWQFVMMLLSLMIGGAASYCAGWWWVGGDTLQFALRPFLMEIAVLTIPIALAIILHQAGFVAYFTILGLVMAQAVRFSQLMRVRAAMAQNLRELQTMLGLGQRIGAALIPGDVQHNAHTEIKQLFDFTHFYIALHNPQHDVIEYPLVMQEDSPQNWRSHPVGVGLTSGIFVTQTPVCLNSDSFQRENDPHLPNDLQAYLGVPLTIGEEQIGVLALAHTHNPHAYSDADVPLLQGFANQTALALRNASLYNRSVKMTDHLSLINHMLSDVVFSLDQTGAMQGAMDIACQINGTDKAAVYLMRRTTPTMSLYLVEATGFEHADELILPPFENTPPRWVVTDIEDNDAHQLTNLAQAIHFRACLHVPLRSGQAIIGALGVYHNAPHYYSDATMNLMQMLAHQITAALDNTELLQALELYATEQAQLVHLSRISSSNLELDRMIRDVCINLTQMLNMEHIEMGIYDVEREHLQIYTPADATQPRQMLPLAQLPDVQAKQEHGIIMPLTYHSDTDNPQLSALLQTHECQTLILVPMHIRGELIGVIFVYNAQYLNLSDNQRRLVEMATNQITAQIYNARVHSLTEIALTQRLEQLALIEELAQQISHSLDVDVIIQRVLDAVLRATDAQVATLALLNEENQVLDIISQDAQSNHRHNLSIAVDAYLINYVTKTGNTITVPDANQSPYRSALTVPLMRGDEMIGVLSVESDKPHAFNTGQASFLRSFAGHAAISIENAHMLEERLHRINTLSYLRDLTLETSTLTHQRQVIHAVLRTTLGLLEGMECALYFYHQPTDEIVMAGGAIRRKSAIQYEAYPPIPDVLIYETVRRERMISVEDTIQHPFYQQYADSRSIKHRSAIAMPIPRQDGIARILCVTFAVPKVFNRRIINTLDLLGVQLGAHLDNAALGEALRNNNDQMRAILDANRDGIILLDRAGRLRDMNRTASEMLQINLDQHISEHFSRIVANQLNSDLSTIGVRQVVAEDSDLNDPNRITEREYTLHAGTAQVMQVRELGVPVQNNDGRLIGRLLSLRDVTAERELAEGRKAIRRFVMHDLRSPLASIATSMHLFLTVLNEDEEIDREFLKDSVDAVLTSTNKLLKLVEDALGGSQEHDQVPDSLVIKQIPVSLRAIGDEAQTVIAPALTQHRFTLVYDIEGDIPDLEVDPIAIQRVLTNLLDNAIKFTPNGGTLMIAADRQTNQAGFVRVMVCDSGPGIPAEQRQTIFRDRVQINAGETQNGQQRGHGLGLAYCKRAVEAHGGKIWVEPEGKLSGACIAFTLPTETSFSMTDKA